MNPFEKAIVGEIPVGEASEFFIKLKYGSAGPRLDPQVVLEDFSKLPAGEREEIIKEAGLSAEETVKVKKAYSEKMLPGTEHYHSDRMRSVLEGLSARVYTPESVDYTTVNGEKLASKKSASQLFKIALELTPDMQKYVQEEQKGMMAQHEAETGYMRSRASEMQQQATSASDAQASTQQQMAALEGQIAQSQQQIQMAQETAINAQSMATQATQGQLTATDEAMRNAQLAAQMRIAYQQLRSGVMDLVSQDPAAGLAEQLKGQAPGMPGIGAEGMSMGAPAQPGAEQQQQQAMMGMMGMDPAAQGGAPAQPGAQQPASPAAPGGAAAAGGQSPAPAKPKPAASESSSPPKKEEPKKEEPKKEAAAGRDAAIGAGVGAALGGIGTALEARKGTGDQKKKVQQLENQGGGFIHALNLAQQKARLALSEAAEQHPVPATIAGSLVGAGVGAGAAPAVRTLMGK